MTAWSLDHARKTYSIPHWAEGYFDVDARGRIRCARAARRVRRSRCRRWSTPRAPTAPSCRCWCASPTSSATAWASCRPRSRRRRPSGTTPAATPRCIRSRSTSTRASPARWPRTRGEGFGLEAGSKPELMAVLALSRPGGLIVCNGYKDREYIRLALIGRKLGLRDLHRDREAVRADAGDGGSEGARRASRAWACACAWPRSAPASGRTAAATRPSSGCRRARCWTCGSRCATPA